jgi:hypothetical protein
LVVDSEDDENDDEEALPAEPENAEEQNVTPEEAEEARKKRKQERKEARRQKRELAKLNQQLMIETALMATRDVPKKVPKKIDCFEFAQKLKGRLQEVVGRFVPFEGTGDGKVTFLTADTEAGAAEAARRKLFGGDASDNEDELLVVAEEPPLKIEPPKKVMGRIDVSNLDGIFGGDLDLRSVQDLPYDPTRVWVAQLPAFQGIDLWDPEVTIAYVAGEVVGSKKDNEDDEDMDDDDYIDPVDENLEDNDSELAPEDDADNDGDDDNNDDGEEANDNAAGSVALSLGGDDSQRFAPESQAAPASPSSLSSLNGLDDERDSSEQGIGRLLKSTIKSQQHQQQMHRTASSQVQDILHILATPKKIHNSQHSTQPFPVPEPPVIQELLSPEKNSATKRSLVFDEDEPVVAPVQPSSSLASSLATSQMLEPEPMEIDEIANVPVVPESQHSQPIVAAPAIENAEPPPRAPSAPAAASASSVVRIVDPVERARKQQRAALGIDRFLVRGNAAKKMVEEKLQQPSPVKKVQPKLTELGGPKKPAVSFAVDDAGIFDSEAKEGSEEESSGKKGKAKATAKASTKIVDDEDEDGEDMEVESEVEEDVEEEDDDNDEERADVPDEEEGEVGDGGRPLLSFQLNDEDANVAFADEDKDGDDVFSAEAGGDNEEEDEEEDGSNSRKRKRKDDSLAAMAAVVNGSGASASTARSKRDGDDADAGASDADAKAFTRIQLERDIMELNRIRDLYVLGQWKTEKQRADGGGGMEDFVDDEFQPNWNSIYNRNMIKHKLKKTEEDKGEEDLNAADKKDEEADSSDNEEEYERKREKLKQSIQMAKIAAIFHNEGSMSVAAAASLPATSSVELGGGSEASLLPEEESSRWSRRIENRRDTGTAVGSNSNMGAFALLRQDKSASIDPMQRFALQRSKSSLLDQAADKNLKRTRSSASVIINPMGRQLFEDVSNGGERGEMTKKQSK